MEQNMTTEAYKREYLAEFTEASTSYFQQELIRKCIENAQRINLEPFTDMERQIPRGDYFAGLDLGKLQDHSALAVVQLENENLKLVYKHEFLLETAYTEVIATAVRANQQFHLKRLLVDQSGIGEPILEQLQNQNVNAEGKTLSQDAKAEILTNLKLTMEQNNLAIPYDKRLCEQINDQQYAYSKNSKLTFTHPQGTHDDQLWALALAVQASKNAQPPQFWVVAKRTTKLTALRQRLSKHRAEGNTR